MNDQDAKVEVVAGDAFAEDAAATKLRILRNHGVQQVQVEIKGNASEVSVSFTAFLIVFSEQMKQSGGVLSVLDDGPLERGMRRLGTGDAIHWEK